MDLVAVVGLPGCVTLEGEDGAGGSIRTPGGRTIPWQQQGIKTLGCPLGSYCFSAGFLAKLAEDINWDLKAIETITSKPTAAGYLVHTQRGKTPGTSLTVTLTTSWRECWELTG